MFIQSEKSFCPFAFTNLPCGTLTRLPCGEDPSGRLLETSNARFHRLKGRQTWRPLVSVNGSGLPGLGQQDMGLPQNDRGNHQPK